MDTCLKLFDIIFSNASKQFIARKFKQYVAKIGYIIKNVLVHIYHSIRLVERYHGPICQIHSIIITKLTRIKFELAFQMFFSALNDLAGSNDLILIFLVFDACFGITDIDTSLLTINQCSIAIHKAIKKVKRFHTFYQINDI